MAPSTQFNMHEAKSNLSKLVERVEAGEEITIARHGRPVARLVPARRPNELARLHGLWAEEEWIAPDIDDLDAEIAELFHRGSVSPGEGDGGAAAR